MALSQTANCDCLSSTTPGVSNDNKDIGKILDPIVKGEDLIKDIQHHYITISEGSAHNPFKPFLLHGVKAGPSPSESKSKIIFLFIHGWPDCWYGWRNQLSYFSSQGFTSLAIDIRGLGESSVKGSDIEKKNEYFSFLNIHKDILLFLNHFHLNTNNLLTCNNDNIDNELKFKLVVVGHDWGGAVAWSFARRYSPIVSGVVSICTPYRPRTSVYVSNEEMARRKPVYFYQLFFQNKPDEAAAEMDEDPESLIRAIYRKSHESVPGGWMNNSSKGFLSNYPRPIPSSTLLSVHDIDNYVKLFKYSGFRAGLNLYGTSKQNWEEEFLVDSHFESSLPVNLRRQKLDFTVTVPALMITAGQDKVLSSDMTNGMEAWVPKLSRGHVEQAAHWVPHESSNEVNKLINQFLKRLNSPLSHL